MKAGVLKFLISFFIVLIYKTAIIACPSCVGKSQRGTPAFFEDELYENGENHETSNSIISSNKSSTSS